MEINLERRIYYGHAARYITAATECFSGIFELFLQLDKTLKTEHSFHQSGIPQRLLAKFILNLFRDKQARSWQITPKTRILIVH